MADDRTWLIGVCECAKRVWITAHEGEECSDCATVIRVVRVAELPEKDHHVLDLREDGWSVEHPHECRERYDSLLDCPVHKLAMAKMNEAGGPPESPGRYRIETPSFALIPEGT